MICQVSAKQLKLVVDSLKDILAQCWLLFNDEGISLRNVDPEKIVAVQLHWKPDKEYYCRKPIHFSLYVQTLYRILRSVRPQSMVQLVQTTPESLLLHVVTQHETTYCVTLQSLQDPIPRFLQPVYDPLLEISFPTVALYRMFHDLAALSRTVCLEILPETLTLRLTAVDPNGTHAEFEHVFPSPDGPVPDIKQTYLLKYMEKFTKSPVAETATLRLHSHAPLRIKYGWDCGFLELSIAVLA